MGTIRAFYFILFFAPALLYAAPDSITDLRVVDTGFRHVTLAWTTPYDTVAGTAPARYEIRCSSAIVIVNDNNWNAYSSAGGFPYSVIISTAEVSQGVSATLVMTGLSNSQSYYFAIRSSTDNTNWSALDTSSPEPIGTPSNSNPGNVSGHNPMNGILVSTVTPTLTWSAPSAGSDDDTYGDYITSYTIELSRYVSFSELTQPAINGITSTLCTITTTWALEENTTYYWRVRAYDTANGGSPGYYTQADRRFVVDATNELPGSFALTSPVSSQIVTDATPDFSWAVPTDADPIDALTYTLIYSTDSAFAAHVSTTIVSIPANTHTLADPLVENATVYWKVYAVDARGGSTVSASTGVFRVNALEEPPSAFDTVSPADSSVVLTSSPIISWQAAVDPDPGDSVAYTVIYSSSDANLILNWEYTSVPGLAATYYQMPVLTEDATYWWKAEAVDTTARSALTATRSFVVNGINLAPAAFGLVSSSGVVTALTPLFDWQDTADADGDYFTYTLYYSTVSNFSVAVSTAGLAVSAYTPAAALADEATYYWKVEAIDIFSNTRASNETWSFIVDAVADDPLAFNLASPADGAELSYLRPSVDWQDSGDTDYGDHVASYSLYYSSSAVFAYQTVITGITVSSYTFTGALANNTTYYWKVLAVSAVSGQTYSNQSRRFIARNTAPGAFGLITSSGIVTTLTPPLSWESAVDAESDAVTYTVYYSLYSDLRVLQSSAGLTVPSFQPPALEENKTYYWYAAAVDAWANEQASSSVWQVMINQLPEPPAGFTPLAPENGATITTYRPQLSWQATTDPDPCETVTYSVSYSTMSDLGAAVSASTGTSTYYSVPANLRAATTYYWRVESVGSDGLSTFSNIYSFYVRQGVTPAAPSGFTASADAGRTKAVLAWNAVTENDDGSAVTGLAGYRVYRAYAFDDVFTAEAAAVLSPGQTTWTDEDISNRTAYYLVKAVNSWGVESVPSAVLRCGADNAAVAYPEDMSANVAIPQEISYSTVTIEITRVTQDENERVLASYLVTARSGGALVSLTFAQPVTLTFKLPSSSASARKAPGSETLTSGIFWYNGVAWVYIGGEKGNGTITAQTLYTGAYQLRVVERSTGFKTLSAWPKIITPNNDGVNDDFNYTFENPTFEKAEGRIFDVRGSRIAAMSFKTDYWLTWQGKNDNGAAAAPGMYIYQVTCGTKVYNGTVIVAK